MTDKIATFTKQFLKKDLPDIGPGDIVKVYQKIKEKGKERIQAFQGQVLAKKHGKEIGATFTVRKVVDGIGVEKIFPIHSPNIEKIEILRKGKARRAKLYYLRKAKGKKARLKSKEMPLPSRAPAKEENKKEKEEKSAGAETARPENKKREEK